LPLAALLAAVLRRRYLEMKLLPELPELPQKLLLEPVVELKPQLLQEPHGAVLPRPLLHPD
jgi:hypothetical protein